MAAETILVQVGESVASIAVGFIADQVQRYISDHFQFQSAVEANLNRLVQDLKKIQVVLCEADKRRIENPRLGDWLQDIKDATYDAEDVLDMFEYKIIQEKVEGTADDENNIFKRCFTCANSAVKKFIVSGDAVKKLNEVVDKFKGIAAGSSDMIQLINSQPAVSLWVSKIMQSRVTTSTPIESKVLGRDKERAQLMKLLNHFSGDGGGSSSSRNFHVLPVVGIGGVGKTTLVQDVYNNQVVKHLFDLRAWVCVSDNFDVKRLTKEIIESASVSKPHDFNSLENLDRIQQILQDGLKDKRFLIVLDDIWNENNTKWEQLQCVLDCGKDGSRVIVTTRNEKIAKMMGTKEAIHLEGLAKEEFWRFFRQCAFGDENPANYPGLEFVGKQIAEKLKGIPLAAKTVGAMLRLDLNGQYWKEVLQSEMWKTNKKEDGIMQALRLSYEYLPSHLKQCFVYCSLFPKDYIYEKTKLVRMWIAHGFILPSGQQLLEKIGEDYLNELLSRSFIHEIFGDYYVIHDLLHDLAQSLSDGEIYIAVNDEARISSPKKKKKVRHISICSNNLSLLCNNDKLGNENVRSLVVFDCSVEKTLDVLSELKGLRVLVLRKFPEELSLKFIQKMLHLRYLEILRPHNRSFNMPELVCKLYHLQVLRVGRNPLFDLCVLPNEINRLIKLRHLEVGKTEGIAWIGSLTLLQELELKVNQGEKGLDIGQIRDMSELRTLCLEGLATIKTKEEASQAMLGNKRHLKVLKLEWLWWEEVLEGSQPHQNQNRLSNRRVPWLCWKEKEDDHRINLLHNEKDEDVLESLQPHSTNLEEFEIRGYRGSYPSWWNANWASNLITLELLNCSKWEFLPPLGHLPFLKVLEIRGMNAVRSIGSEFYASNSVGLSSKTIFPSLEQLDIVDMPELKDWYKIEEGGGGGGGGFELFPRLKNFRIGGCPKLRGSIFQFPPSNFNQIHVEIGISDSGVPNNITEGLIDVNCDSASKVTEWLPYPNLVTSVEHLKIKAPEEMRSCFPTELVEWIQHLTSLHSLCFSKCRDVESLPEEGLPASIQELLLKKCKKLESLPSNLISLSTLRKLEIVECPNIKSLPEEGLPASLQELLLEDCEKLEYLPSNLISLSTLRILNIERCPNIKSLPEEGLPASLQELIVKNCKKLESLPSNLISLSTLQKLEIVECPNIKSLPEKGLPASLQELLLKYCEKLESLPSNLISLSTLRILKIVMCPKIKSLPEEGLPASLRELELLQCYDLAKRCMNEDWQKMIAHIPTFTVDGKVVTEENRKSLKTKTLYGDYSYAAEEED